MFFVTLYHRNWRPQNYNHSVADVQETVQKHLASATKKLVDEAALIKIRVDLLAEM